MKHFFYLFLSAALLAAAGPALGAHIVGSALTYKYLKTDTDGTPVWEFELTILRDCGGGGAPFDNTPAIAVYRGDGVNNQLYSTFHISGGLKISKIETNCPLQPAPNVCFEKGVYRFLLGLPDLATQSYFVVYQRCCYSVSIRNLEKPGDQGITVYTELTPAAMRLKNNSPVFENIPPLYTTRIGGVWFLPKIQNIDGDQLKFRLAPPAAGGGPILISPGVTSCEGATPDPPCEPPFADPGYAPGYSATRPFASNDQIDENTGLFTVQSDYIGLYLTGIAVDEYRNGERISTTLLQFTIVVGDGSETCFFYTVGANDLKDTENALTVSPSPAEDQITIQWPSTGPDAAYLHIYDAQGRLLQRRVWPAGATEQTMQVAQWPAGLYYTLVADGSGGVHRKGFVKQ